MPTDAEIKAQKKADAAREGAKAMRDYQTAQVKALDNMARLRELRLAKEAADQAAGVTPGKKAPKAAKAKPKSAAKAVKAVKAKS